MNKQQVIYNLSIPDLVLLAKEVVRQLPQDQTDLTYEDDDRLSQTEAADFLETTVQTLIHWREEKKLPHIQLGRRFFYSKKLLKAYMHNGK